MSGRAQAQLGAMLESQLRGKGKLTPQLMLLCGAAGVLLGLILGYIVMGTVHAVRASAARDRAPSPAARTRASDCLQPA